MSPTTIDEAPEMFQVAVNSLAMRPAFLAHVFATVFGGDVSAKRIAAELACSEASALRIAMMTVPQSEGQRFRDDIARIGLAAGVEYGLLLSVVRQAQVLAAFDPGGVAGDALLAARDVVPNTPDRES